MNSTTKQTLIEVVKIVSKMTAVVVLTGCLWYALAQGYLWYGFSATGSEALAFATLIVPYFTYCICKIIWLEAKHRVWKRENNVE